MSAFLLKRADERGADGQEQFLTIGGFKGGYAIETQPLVESAVGPKGAWETLADGKGITSVQVEATGIFASRKAEQETRDAAIDKPLLRYQIAFEWGGKMTGSWMIIGLEYLGDQNGERSYRIRLQSSGEISAS